MSDDDMDMMFDEDDYLDDDDGEEGGEGFEIENEYYNAKGMLEDDVGAAIEGYESVVTMEEEKGEWGFKALKKLVKLCLQEGQRDKAVDKFTQLMTYTDGAVSANTAEKGIGSVLDSLANSHAAAVAAAAKAASAAEASGGAAAAAAAAGGASPADAETGAVVERLYEIAVTTLRKQGSERVWFRQALKYAKLLMDNGKNDKLLALLEELHASCRAPGGGDDPKKGSQLVDIYAIEIQLHSALDNHKQLKVLYYQALAIKSAIPHPRILGTIRECGGKMHLREGNWDDAYSDFFDAFKNYDEAGSPRRISCLKYLILANLLANMSVDPFDSTESKPYKSHPEIVPMDRLKDAFHSNNVAAFEKVLKQDRAVILEDSFIKGYIPQLMRIMRIRVLKNLLRPYQSIGIPFVASELNIPDVEVEDLMVELILDGEIHGKLDQVAQTLVLTQATSSAVVKYRALEHFAANFGQVQLALASRMA